MCGASHPARFPQTSFLFFFFPQSRVKKKTAHDSCSLHHRNTCNSPTPPHRLMTRPRTTYRVSTCCKIYYISQKNKPRRRGREPRQSSYASIFLLCAGRVSFPSQCLLITKTDLSPTNTKDTTTPRSHFLMARNKTQLKKRN